MLTEIAGSVRHLFLLPHPDDEFACSATISDLTRGGAEVRCCYMTDGGYGGQDTQRRRREAVASLGSLSVKADDIRFPGMEHGFADGALHRHADRAFLIIAQEIQEVMDGRRAVVLHIPAWEGGHQDHDTTHALGVLASRELSIQVVQFPLYNGAGLRGPLFRVLHPLDENGAASFGRRLSMRERVAALRLCLRYPSQWKSWIGLLPLFGLHLLRDGRFVEQPATMERIKFRPHAGPLLYERRSKIRYKDIEAAIRPFH